MKVASDEWFRLVRSGRALCPSCKRKGLGFSDHPHAFGWKDYDTITCRYCRKVFKTPKAQEVNP